MHAGCVMCVCMCTCVGVYERACMQGVWCVCACVYVFRNAVHYM